MIPPQTLGFLTELAENNDRDWFNTNKSRYEQQVRDPALAFITDFQGPLSEISDQFLAVPKVVGGSLFRIYRDTRFSKDKTPYKTNTGMQFRHRLASKDVHAPGFYLHIEPGRTGVGVGMWMPDNAVLNKVRTAIVEDPEGWSQLKSGLAGHGFSFMESDKDLKRVPRGFDADHQHADDLRRKSIAVHRSLTDAQVTDPAFIHTLAGCFQEASPLVAFLCDTMELPF